MINSVKYQSEYKQLLALFLGIFTILLFFFGEVLLAPNDYLLQKGGDGLKNYHTLVWYLDHDSGSHFTGMNYPYGEHIVYTDNQPALAVALKFIHQYITPISHKVVGIVNSLIFLSIFTCGLLLYLILRKFSVEPWFAVAFALLICFMSPQLRRINGHYSLAYCVFIPLLWHQLMSFMENRQVFKRALGIVLLICLFSFLHLYYLLIGTLMVFAYTFVWALRRRKILPKKRMIYLTAIGLLPLIIVAVILGATDTVADRPTAPGGFFHYRAFFKSIFIPVVGPVQEYLDENILSTSHRFESQAYVGFIAFLVLIFSLVKFIRKGVASKFKQFPKPILSVRMNDWLWAGILVLLFSTAFPFTLGLQFLLDYIPGLRQFRSLGRFAWVFYYIVGVYAAYYCYLAYRYLRIKGKESFAVVALLATFSIWGAEVYFYLNAADEPFAKNVYFANKSDDLESKLAEEGYIIDEFQAMLILPYYLIGSEKTFINRYWKSFSTSIKYSQQVGLPLAQGNLSRTSTSQTLHLAQQVTGPLIKKEILADLPNNKPFLVLAYDKELLADEKNLLKKGTVIGKLNKLTIYELPLAAFNNNFKSIWHTYGQGNLTEYNGTLTDKPSKSVYVDELEEPNSGLFFQGKERKRAKSEQLILVEGTLDANSLEKDYQASIWIYADPNFSSYPILKLERYNEKGNLLNTIEKKPNDNTESTEGWLRVALDFEYYRKETLKFYLEGKGITAASFQIRPKRVKVYQEIKKGKVLNYNNYFIER